MRSAYKAHDYEACNGTSCQQFSTSRSEHTYVYDRSHEIRVSITTISLLIAIHQVSLCMICLQSLGGRPTNRPMIRQSVQWVGLSCLSRFFSLYLPSSSSKALVTAAFTPTLATRTRLVKVRRHIGVMNATGIISCLDILHPGSSVDVHGDEYYGCRQTGSTRGAGRGEKSNYKGGDSVKDTPLEDRIILVGTGHRCSLLNVSSPLLHFWPR